jgi:hypothetical protein
MSTTETPVILHPDPPPLAIPTIQVPPPTNIHFRVIVQGEVDVEIPDNADQQALARAVANDIKTKNPSFKITKVLMAEGIGPIAKPL